MKYVESKDKIYETTDYEKFVFPEWNRGVSNARIVKMVESIKTFGWLPEPVLVNEKLEVIDGQSRIKALEKLNMPVQFCIKQGVSRKECQALNLFQKNWTTNDYINSYIADGNENYIWLKEMLQKFHTLSATIVQIVAVYKNKPGCMNGGGYVDKITSGKLVVSPKDRIETENLLFYLSRFADTIDYLGGRKDTFYTALSFMYYLDDVDNERVCTVVNNARYDGLVTSGTVEGWLQQIESLYNKKLAKKNKVDIIHEYKVA